VEQVPVEGYELPLSKAEILQQGNVFEKKQVTS
jgi:hypothetical protein